METERVTETEVKFPDRFWVSLGSELHNDLNDFADEFNGKLNVLSNKISDVGSLSFATFDLEEARKVATDTIALYKEYFPHLGDVECGVFITTQPKCPKCGKYARFSELHCSRCGGELALKGYIDIESEEDDLKDEQNAGYRPDNDEDTYCPHCEDGGELEFDEEILDDKGGGYDKYHCKTCGKEIHATFERHLVWVK